MTYKRIYRQTIKGALSFSSAGIHSGEISTMSLFPAVAGSGIVFSRSDKPNSNHLKICHDCVIDTTLSTKIAVEDSISISTIEHIMSALFACGIDDVRIQLDGEEIPIMDGSAKDFTDRIMATGTCESTEKLKYIKVLKRITVNHADSSVTLSPYDGFIIDAQVDFKKGGIGIQKLSFNFDTDCYQSTIAPARTFGFQSDIEYLQKKGLALGGGVHNAIIYSDIGTDQSLRFENECITHKVLDVIGDLYVCGMPLLCRVDAVCMGHTINNAILHELFSDTSNFEIV